MTSYSAAQNNLWPSQSFMMKKLMTPVCSKFKVTCGPVWEKDKNNRSPCCKFPGPVFLYSESTTDEFFRFFWMQKIITLENRIRLARHFLIPCVHSFLFVSRYLLPVHCITWIHTPEQFLQPHGRSFIWGWLANWTSMWQPMLFQAWSQYLSWHRRYNFFVSDSVPRLQSFLP